MVYTDVLGALRYLVSSTITDEETRIFISHDNLIRLRACAGREEMEFREGEIETFHGIPIEVVDCPNIVAVGYKR